MRNDSTLIDAGRRRQERWLYGLGAAFSGFAAVSFAAQSASAAATVVSLPFAVAFSAVSASMALLSWFGPPVRWEGAVRVTVTTVETSVPFGVILTSAQVSREHALLDAPAALWVMAIFLNVLRLRPSLALYSGTLAAVEWLTAYLLISHGQHFEMPVLLWPSAVRRATILFVAGVLAWKTTATLLDLAVRVERESVERDRVRRAFGAYVAGPVVERILSGDLALRTERRDLTLMFVDIRGFTSLSERMLPEDVVSRLNLALEQFSVAIQVEGGIVNKFLGDGLMAIFGAPEHYADHPARAVRAALAIRAIAEELDRSGAFAGLRIGVGVHRGDVVVGDIGGERQREYTAIGDAVNVASRVEGATKELGEDVLITSAVAERVAGLFTLRPHGAVALRGRIDGVGVFGVAALSPETPELPTAQSAMNHRGPGASPHEPLEAPPAG